ncbi:uroporphyrinogen-III synthase [Roseibium sp. M-1]
MTRPQPDCRRTAEALRALGHDADEAPVLQTTDCLPDRFDLAGVTALAFSSRRAVTLLCTHAQVDALKSLPVFTVGDATAEACRKAGFATVSSAAGDVAALAGLILDNRQQVVPGHVLYPAAKDRAGDLEGRLAAGGLSCHAVAIYRMDPVTALPLSVVEALQAGAYDGVLIYSRRTAEAFRDLTIAHLPGYNFCHMRAYALSPQAAAPLSKGFAVQVAAAPTETALFDLALAEC